MVLINRKAVLSVVLLSLLISFAGLNGCNSDSGNVTSDKKVITLNLTTTISDTHSRSVNVIRPWMNVVHEASDGKIEFRVYYANSLMSAAEQPEGLLYGQVDVASTMPGVVADKFPGSQVTYATPIIPNLEVPNLALLKTYQAIPKYQEQYADYHVIWEGSGSLMHLYTDKEVKTLDDAKGLVIGVSSNLLAKTVTKLGMTPVVGPFGDFFTSLETGVIDGVMSSHDPISSWGMGKLVPFCLEIGVTTWPNGLLVSKKAYDKLSQDLKDAIDTVPAEQMSYWNDIALKRDEAASKEKFIGKGGTMNRITEGDIAKAQKILKVVYQEMIDWYKQMGYPGEELVETYQNFCNTLTFDDYDKKYSKTYEEMGVSSDKY